MATNYHSELSVGGIDRVAKSLAVGEDKDRTSNSHQPMSEDEKRLNILGYKQEVKRIFGTFTNFGSAHNCLILINDTSIIMANFSTLSLGLAASMISILLGIIPLYTYSLTNGIPI